MLSRTSLPTQVETLLEARNLDAWTPERRHASGGRLYYYRTADSIKVVPYTDNDPDCPVCGPRLRLDAHRLIDMIFLAKPLHLLVAYPQDRDTIGRQVRRKDAEAIWVPLNGQIVLLTTTEVTNRQSGRSSDEIPDDLRQWVYALALRKWRKGKTGRMNTIPQGLKGQVLTVIEPWRKKRDPDTEKGFDLGTVRKPNKFIKTLANDGIYTRQPGHVGEVHARWCDQRLQAALDKCGWQRPGNAPPDWAIPTALHPDHQANEEGMYP